MLCISAAYAVMHSCGVRASVCPSVTFVHSVKTNKDIFEIFSQSGSSRFHHSSFPYQTGWRYSDGIPPVRPNGGVLCRWGRQKSRFWAYVASLSCWSGGVVLTNHGLLQQAMCCQYDAAGPPYAHTLWNLSLVVSGGVDSRRDEEMFMTRSLNVTPKTTEQRI